jgi:hypothetical protein
MAFLRRKQRTKGGETYDSWALVESVRTAKGPRQRTIATLGKCAGSDSNERVGWEDIARELSGRGRSTGGQTQPDMFKAPVPETPVWARVDAGRVRVERVRRFGDVYVALALWKRLRLDEFFSGVMEAGREQVPWPLMAAIHTVARLCEPSSDLAIAESFFGRTALDDLLGVDGALVNDDRLYRALDVLVVHREALFGHLRSAYGELFGCEFDVLLYDATSTFFEGQMPASALGRRGYSRDSRPDCLQVLIGLVVTPQGLPLAYEVFEGNRHDSKTVSRMMELMEERYGRARRTWVLDRGMVGDDNIAELRRREANYIVGTPRQALRKFEREMLEKDWEKVEPGIELKLVPAPAGTDSEGQPDPGATEMFVLCRSQARIAKDAAIVARAEAALASGLEKLQEQAGTGRLRCRATAERRIGRLLERNSRAARLFSITVTEIPDPAQNAKPLLEVKITRNESVRDWLHLQNGCYLLRTNLTTHAPHDLWRTYIGLTQAEAAFRDLKSPLGLRPIHHHNDQRIGAHILTCFLPLCMRRTLALWMETAGLGQSPDKLLRELQNVTSLDAILPTSENIDLRLRLVSTPEPHIQILLQKLQIRLPNRPRFLTPPPKCSADFFKK